MKQSTTRTIALIVIVGLVLSTVATAVALLWPTGEEDERTLPPIPVPEIVQTDDLTPFMEQELQFVPCSLTVEALQCAWLAVPLDHADPAGPVINLAVQRMGARDEDDRIGSLVVNPGGPGGSGVEMVANIDGVLGNALTSAFDVVGFDPRGVGKSAPLDCLSDADLNAYVDLPTPTTASEMKAVAAETKKFAEGCATLSGELVEHVDTVSAAKDMDVLRAALGEETLTYYGASYGTKLGATYAELFPEKVGKFVLDGGMDPTLGQKELALGQAEGFEVALRAYVESCQSGDDCPLEGDVDAGVEQIRDFLASVEDEPLQAGADEITAGEAFYGVITPLYREDYWPMLTQVLALAFEGDGSMLKFLADSYLSRQGDTFISNSLEASAVINCLDDPSSLSVAQIEDVMGEFEKASPTFGPMLATGLGGCAGFGFDAPEKLVIDADGAAPILVTATTRDPATPYAWGVALAEQLDSGVLISREGDGHTAYNAGNACVDTAIEEYFLDGVTPSATLNC